RFAESGFVVFACDMYGEGVAGDRQRVMQQIAEFRRNPDSLCQRAKAGLTLLNQHPIMDGRKAAVGYCFGGMTVLELARSGREPCGYRERSRSPGHYAACFARRHSRKSSRLSRRA